MEPVAITGEPCRTVLDVNWCIGEDNEMVEVVLEWYVPVRGMLYPVIAPTC